MNFSYRFVPAKEGKYSMDKGYGYTFSAGRSLNEDLRDSWPGEYFIPNIPTFLIDVPKGNYKVIVTLGSPQHDSITTVKEGLGHVKVYQQEVSAGEPVKKEFCVHVDDGQIKLAFGGEAPSVQHIEVTRSAMIPTVYLAGDSTVTDQASGKYPYSGWGQMIGYFIGKSGAISNHARSGRSSKSFIEEGRLNRITKEIRKGDYLLIQFAHNDQKDNQGGTEPFSTYQAYLKQYIDTARKKEAFPILIAPMHRRFYLEDGSIENTHGDYIEAMYQLSMKENVPFIDLASLSKRYLEDLGEARSKQIFLWAEQGQYENLPEGARDNTHFSEFGAFEIAKLIASSMREKFKI